MRHALWLVLALAVQLATTRAAAQDHPPGPGPQRWDTVLDGGRGAPLVVRTTWTARDAAGHRTARIDVMRVRASDAHETPIAMVYEGPLAMTAAASREGAVAVVAYNGGDAPFVRVITVALDEGDRASVRTASIDGVGAAGFRPARAAACADEQGFTVLWQQDGGAAGAATAREARTSMGRISTAGTWATPPHEVQVPWALGAVAWTGHGYDLAIRYDGSVADQTHVCLVTLSTDGVPQQHPWWVSPPEAVGAIALVPSPRGTWVVWRNATAARIEATLSTAPGAWGTVARAPEPRGAVAPSEVFGERLSRDDDGGLELVRIHRAPQG